MAYNPQKIEKKWQRIWEKKGIFEVDLKKTKKPYYNLMMFPYPSAEGLHVGNVYAFTGSDIYGRFQRMRGRDVFEPIGFDAFGIHSENFAIKKKIHPKVLIQRNINNFRRQLKNLGCLFDWQYEVDTTKPNYYKWTQWLFLQLFKNGLAYRKKALVDWCPSCKTVLANEQVISGKCERCESSVIQKEKEQWFFRITKYAERLLKNLDMIDWSKRTKLAQKNWIGRSEGTTIKFETREMGPVIVGRGGRRERSSLRPSKFEIPVFTTRADTLFGCTYIVIAPEHPIIKNLESRIQNLEEVKKYIEKAKKRTEIERLAEDKEKTGIELKGVRVINPINDQETPIFTADYVLMEYGTGAIMAVPAHDQRDFLFAKKHNLPIVEVIKSETDASPFPERAVEEDGILVNSGQFSGLKSVEARIKMTKWLEEKKRGKRAVYYKLRDWLISRQRYWGPPIPIIYCQKCGILPVPEKDLPVLLPYVENFRPTGKDASPLSLVKKFVKVKCPKCNSLAKRETDVSDTFLDSSWYYLRYPSAKFENHAFDKQLIKKWLPVDMYIGGQEHAVLHLMYSRFITMALYDLGYIDFEEPFKKFRAHGLITKGGMKMSKSKGNIVNPDDYYKKYGADTLRMYLMFIGPFFEGGDWQDKGIVGIKRFLNKLWGLEKKVKKGIQSQELNILINRTIKKITEDLENLRYNTIISALMIAVNKMTREENISIFHYSTLLTLLAPFAPHIAEELWQKIGGKDSIHNQKWPRYDSKLVKEEIITLIVQVNGKVRDKIETEAGVSENEAKELALLPEKVQKWIKGRKIKKVIFVPGKLINIVI